MTKTITYINRKQQATYHSIESVFDTVINAVSTTFKVSSHSVNHSGGSPKTILFNCKQFKKSKNTVYHITGDVHYMAIATGRHTVLTIHDIGSALSGFLLKRLYVKLFWFWLPAMRVNKIAVISEFTKKELIKLVPFAKDKISVVPNPIGQEYELSIKTFNTVLPKILIVGTKPNKNLERIFKALSSLECELIIIGKLNEQQRRLLNTYQFKFDNKFNIPKVEMIMAYKDCDFLCFASTYEGFGMPIIEAQKTGRPVLTSNLGAMKEVAQNAACLVDPYDVNSIRQGAEKIISDKGYRERLIEQGLINVERYSVETVAKSYISIYNQMMNEQEA